MKKIFLLGILGFLLTMSLPCIAQKDKNKNKEEVKPPPPPPMEGELRTVVIDTASSPDRIYPVIDIPDTTSVPEDELTLEIRKMMTLTGSINLGLQFARSLTALKESDDSVLPPQFYERFFDEITIGPSKKLFENAILKVYRKHLTVEDVKQLNAFYETPTGKKYTQLLPVFMEESQKAGEGVGRYLGMKIYLQLVKEGVIK